MKILFLCHRFPYPPDHGAKIRAYHFIRHLSRTHSVTVATLAQSQQELADGAGLRDCCEEVIAQVVPGGLRWIRSLMACGTRLPSCAAYFWSAEFQKRVQQNLKKQNFDVIVVFCAFMAQYVLGWRDGYRVLDYVDIDSVKWSEYARYRSFPLAWAYSAEAAKLRAYERIIAEHFDYCTVVSPGELEEFQKFNVNVPCTVVPNGVDTNYFCVTDAGRESSTIAFLGRMDYFPNIDGITYFAREVLPIIRNRRPDVELRIVGSSPTKSVRELAKIPKVTVTGHVPDVRPYLKDAAVSIVPLRIARGTQNKILESMAMGIPVVATSDSAKGVDVIPGRHLLVADSRQQFAANIIDILEDRALRQKLVGAARLKIEESHSWVHSAQILDRVLNRTSDAHELSGPTLSPGNMLNEKRIL